VFSREAKLIADPDNVELKKRSKYVKELIKRAEEHFDEEESERKVEMVAPVARTTLRETVCTCPLLDGFSVLS